MNNLLDNIWNQAQQEVLDAPEITINEGQALQLKLLRRYLDQGETLAGYKIGLTSGNVRNDFGAGIRPFGYILQSHVFQSGDQVPLKEIGNTGLENELVFRVGKSFSGSGVSASDAQELIEAVAPAFEINQTRFIGSPSKPVSNGLRLADNLAQWGIVTGKFISIEQAFGQDSSDPYDKSFDKRFDKISVSMTCDGEEIQRVNAKDHIYNHFDSIAAHVNRLHQYGRGLKAGELIITGSFTKQEINSPGLYRGDFGEIGQVDLHLV